LETNACNDKDAFCAAVKLRH